MGERILLVEDHEELGSQVCRHLARAGYSVDWLRDGDTALAARLEGLDLVVLDLMLPGAYGMDVLKRVRKESAVPVLVLSARNDTADKVRALKLGADDYLTKPFWPEELLARVSARLRRPGLGRDDRLRVGPFAIDVAGRRLEIEGRACDLTRAEFEFLVMLARRPGAAIPRQDLIEEVLVASRSGTERTLDAHASRLRRKLGAYGRHVRTVWGIGYRLDPEVST